MRAIVVAAVLLASGTAAAELPLIKLTCEVIGEDGKRVKLPAKRIRIETPVECRLSAEGGKSPAVLLDFRSRLTTSWKEYDDDGKPVAKKVERHAGVVKHAQPWTVRLEPDQDFVGCLDFAISAELYPAAGDKPAKVWSQKLRIKQFCPD